MAVLEVLQTLYPDQYAISQPQTSVQKTYRSTSAYAKGPPEEQRTPAPEW